MFTFFGLYPESCKRSLHILNGVLDSQVHIHQQNYDYQVPNTN